MLFRCVFSIYFRPEIGDKLKTSANQSIESDLEMACAGMFQSKSGFALQNIL